MLKAEPDYEDIDEIRILNDGGGTGCWHIALKPAFKKIRAINVPMKSVYAKPDHVDPAEYYEVDNEHREFG